MASTYATSKLMTTSYWVAKPNEYIIKSGAGISDVSVHKSCWKFPLQLATVIEISPDNYEFKIHAMSCEKIEFVLPCVFTIGPVISSETQTGGHDYESIKKYAKLISQKSVKEINEFIIAIVEGETRILAAKMSLEDIFSNRSKLKDSVIAGIQDELDQYGLKVFNAK